jgi:hypothetical protein
MLFLGMEGGSKGGAILNMELPERGGNIGKEPDAVPWNRRRVQGYSFSYYGIASERKCREGTRCCFYSIM